jgi:hypothetical protein
MRPMFRRCRSSAGAALLCGASWCVLAVASPDRALEAQGLRRSLPTSLSDAQFWKLVTDLSEPGGTFQSDNFASNEMGFPRVVSTLRAGHDTGGAYLGVGPEQNFTYIAAIRPQIAFIVDIRRQAVVQHLMYKAIFELAKDRADFVSLLFSKPRPKGLDSNSTVAQIWDAYWTVSTDTAAYRPNLARIATHLTKTHGFPLDADDLASLAYVYRAFYELGPIITYSSYSGPATISTYQAGGGTWIVPPTIGARTLVTTSNGTVIGTTYDITSSGRANIIGAGAISPFAASAKVFHVAAGPVVGPEGPAAAYYGGVNFASVTASTDPSGSAGSFLATEDNYRVVRELENKNLIIPVVGDFGARKALQGVAHYLRDSHATVTAFYTSNVEEYLFGDGIAARLYSNLDSLPVTPTSVLIRNGTDICTIAPFLVSVAAGRVKSYDDALACRQ